MNYRHTPDRHTSASGQSERYTVDDNNRAHMQQADSRQTFNRQTTSYDRQKTNRSESADRETIYEQPTVCRQQRQHADRQERKQAYIHKADSIQVVKRLQTAKRTADSYEEYTKQADIRQIDIRPGLDIYQTNRERKKEPDRDIHTKKGQGLAQVTERPSMNI